ncbi:RNA polymerase sigma factor [Chitinophaga agrisoli]|uniref:RNA polymerase sigma factor n=1 Tax=Chitinophaga agrisoli TaxID=2607653 RepID=UPI001661E3EB|nr:sigma-70 family RNA polymerase sigma factor [Chitinophaga agrisoli]
MWQDIQQGDAKAFERLYQQTVIGLTNQAYSVLKDRELTQDILQDIYVSLYLRRFELPADINIGGYLNNAVKYKVSTILRDRLARAPHHSYLLRQEQEAEASQPDPYEHVALRQRIKAGIDTLPEKCRQAFMLNYYNSLSYKAIAHEMGISVKTVEKHISKALQVLRRELSGELYLFIAIAVTGALLPG